MKRKLKTIAMQLSDSDIQELIRIRKMEDKRVVALRKKRDKLAADLAKLDGQIAKLVGDAGDAPAEPKRRGRKPNKEKAAAGAKKPGRKPGRRKGGRTARTSLSVAVREVLAKAGAPLKASQVVDALPEAGVKVPNVADMRKRISVVLASQKNHFEQVERGVYRLKEE